MLVGLCLEAVAGNAPAANEPEPRADLHFLGASEFQLCLVTSVSALFQIVCVSPQYKRAAESSMLS